MELHKQIKKYRTELNLSQEQLAEKVYVSRQTISSWENNKSYPDINSLILLSSVFETSIDSLIKGDIEIMKAKINENDAAKIKKYSLFYGISFVIFALSMFIFVAVMGRNAIFATAPFLAVSLGIGIKLGILLKQNDIGTYKEIEAFIQGKELTEAEKRVEKYKRWLFTLISVILGGFLGILIMKAALWIVEA